MGCGSSTPNAVRWDERWSSPSCKKTLHQFCDHKMKPGGEAIVTGTMRSDSGAAGDDASKGDFSGPVSKDGEFRNWAGSVQTKPARVFTPKSASEVQQLLAQVRAQKPMPKVRCMGSSHSWSPHFADDGAWMLDTSGMNKLDWSADQPKQVTIGPGVTGGQLATYMDAKERGKWRGLFLASDVVLESVTYGGVINVGCHGAGKTQTVADYVLKTSIMKWDGTQVDLVRADDPAGFALKVLSLGLLGVTVEYTLQLDGDVSAIRVTDSKVPARMLFLGPNELPKPGGKNPLREAWNGGYATEIFYFPASSLKISNILSNEFEDQKWDPYNDICAVKAFQRTKNTVKKDNDRFLGANPKTSTRFDRNFSIMDYLRINLGAELGLPLIAKHGDKPALVAMYSRTAVRALEPLRKLSGQVYYEASLAQAIHWQRYITDGPAVADIEVCIKCDPDFASAYKAIHAAIGIVKDFAEKEDTMPLNVAMELRFTKHSTSPMSPAYGRESYTHGLGNNNLRILFPAGDVFMWIEVLSSVNTPRLKDFATRVADAWLAIKLKDGSPAAHPHWTKWSEAYVAGADAKMKRAFASHLPLLRQVASQFDPHGVFTNDYFAKLLAP